MSEKAEQDYSQTFEFLGRSGQIERYKVAVFSNQFKTLATGLILGFFCGFLWGVVVMSWI